MAKNILLISSEFTGHGHKSITESLMEQFSMHKDVKVHVVDGFALGGALWFRLGKMYGSVTRNAKELWKMVWEMSIKNPKLIMDLTELTIQDSFMKLLKNTKPDLIIAVHANFVGSVLNILEKYKIKIPFVTLIADLVSITPLWADPRADYTICPTRESAEICKKFGVPEERIKLTGFPVRARFCESGRKARENFELLENRPLELLLMSGGEGSGNLTRLSKKLLDNYNCKVKIITGRNKVLKKRLESVMPEKYPGRVEIYGFVDNVQDLIASSDIAFTRGSPNVMMEVITCNVPLVVTGALPGQEEGNPGFLKKYHLGVVCKDIKKLTDVMDDLLADNGKKLNQIKKAQREFRDMDTPKNIVEFVLAIESKGKVIIPDLPKKFRLAARTNSLLRKTIKRKVKVARPPKKG